MIVLKSKHPSIFIAISRDLLIALTIYTLGFCIYKFAGGDKTLSQIWPVFLGLFLGIMLSSLRNWRIRKIAIDLDNKILICWYRTAFKGIVGKSFPFHNSQVKFERHRKWFFGRKVLSEVKIVDEKRAFIRVSKYKDGMDVKELERYLLPLTSAIEA